MAAGLEAPRAGARPVTVTAPARRAGLAWPPLPAAAELAAIGAGYLGYALVRLAIRAGRHAAFAHAARLWQAEQRLHLPSSPTSTTSPRRGPRSPRRLGISGLIETWVRRCGLAGMAVRQARSVERSRRAGSLTACRSSVAWLSNDVPPCRGLAVAWLKRGANAS